MELPCDFVSLMQEQWGKEISADLCASLSESEPSVSVRLNPAKLPGVENVGQTVPWCKNGYYLSSRPAFTFDPIFHAGAYYVQDASSMFLAHIVEECVQQPVVALDLCAAPGGKSTLLAACLPEGSLLVSNEPIPQRSRVLVENMTKWGYPNVIVTQNYPVSFSLLREFFDLVVADVPCSGEGMFRKDPQAIDEWSLRNVSLCRDRQREIVESAWPALKPGGLFVYSTCTFNRQENEENVDWICTHLGAEQVSIGVDQEWGIIGHYHFFPGLVRGEGQFMAVLRKSDFNSLSCAMDRSVLKNKPLKSGHKVKYARKKVCTLEPANLREWVEGDFCYVQRDDTYYAFPLLYDRHLSLLQSHLNLLTCGVTIATSKGREWQPKSSLAMSLSRCKAAFPSVEIGYEQALAFLRHESIQVDAPKGYVLLTYHNQALGFVKNLGCRANNLYPHEWRIRSTYATPYTLL